jgi:methyl-accepting chemotaxis protein
MSARLGFGKIIGLLRPRWGIRGSLFAAFAVIAGMAIAISAGAGMVLQRLGVTMINLSGQDIPRLATSLQLSALSASLAAQGPALLSAPNENTLGERTRKMKETQDLTQQKLGEIIELANDKAVVNALGESIKNISEATQSLVSASRERLAATAEHDKQFDALLAAHANFIAAANPVMLEAQTSLNAILSSAVPSPDDANKSAQTVDEIGNVVASGNLAAAQMAAALSANSNDTLDTLVKDFKAAQGRIRSNLDQMSSSPRIAALQEAANKLLTFGDNKSGVFRLREKELDAIDYGQTVLEETRKLNVGLDISVQQLVEGVRKETDAATWMARQDISFATMVMLALGAATLLGSALFVWRYVGANILHRIGALQRSMRLLSDGDLETEIYRSKQKDEIAAMADALEVFRESMIRARSLSNEQDTDRVTKSERAARMETRIVEFEASVRAALDNLQRSAGSMEATAQGMSSTADRSNALVSAVATAAEETSTNVQSVSAGTEELSSSIAEIGRQVVNSAQVARKAVEEAGATDTTMQGLADNASRISVVVDLIQVIASQTNLLALNATIEAARAGEAGRGFAVVASEVKSLASQTAKATDEIRTQISSMQEVTTSAVSAIRNIGQTIGEINEVTTAIAAAVEEQGAATREIARNIQHAAGGTTQVSSHIVGVSSASAEAGTAAAQVLNASAALRREAEGLRADIDTFLSNIRAA